MGLEIFKAEAIATMDGGRIGAAIDLGLEQMLADCTSRPGLDKARKLTLEITMSPVPDDRELGSIDVAFNVKTSIPGKESRSFNMLPTRDGLQFNELSPEDAAQTTIEPGPYVKPAGKEKKSNVG